MIFINSFVLAQSSVVCMLFMTFALHPSSIFRIASITLMKDAKTNKELSDRITVSSKRCLYLNHMYTRGNRSLDKVHLSFVLDPLSTASQKHGNFPDPSLFVNTAGLWQVQPCR